MIVRYLSYSLRTFHRLALFSMESPCALDLDIAGPAFTRKALDLDGGYDGRGFCYAEKAINRVVLSIEMALPRPAEFRLRYNRVQRH